MEVDKLQLSDAAIAELVSGKLNNRLLSEIIAHPDFAELLAALEVFVDHVISENMEIVNKLYGVSLDTITAKKIPEEKRDEYLARLQEASIDPDDYLRFRLSQRFEKVAQGIYDAHKKEALSKKAGQGFIKKLVGNIQNFKDIEKKTGSVEEAGLAIFADQMGVDIKKKTAEERKTILGFLFKPKPARRLKKRK